MTKQAQATKTLSFLENLNGTLARVLANPSIVPLVTFVVETGQALQAGTVLLSAGIIEDMEPVIQTQKFFDSLETDAPLALCGEKDHWKVSHIQNLVKLLKTELNGLSDNTLKAWIDNRSDELILKTTIDMRNASAKSNAEVLFNSTFNGSYEHNDHAVLVSSKPDQKFNYDYVRLTCDGKPVMSVGVTRSSSLILATNTGVSVLGDCVDIAPVVLKISMLEMLRSLLANEEYITVVEHKGDKKYALNDMAYANKLFDKLSSLYNVVVMNVMDLSDLSALLFHDDSYEALRQIANKRADGGSLNKAQQAYKPTKH